MRRAAAALTTLIFALALSACGGGTDVLAQLRAGLEGAGEVRITAGEPSLSGTRPSEYNLTLERTDGGLTVTVNEPEEIAGVSAVYDEDTLSLEYEGLILPAPVTGEVSPITALPELLDALENGYEALSWSEGEDTYVSLEPSDGLGVTVRFNSGGEPVWAELLVGGESAVQCEITEFTVN